MPPALTRQADYARLRWTISRRGKGQRLLEGTAYKAPGVIKITVCAGVNEH